MEGCLIGTGLGGLGVRSGAGSIPVTVSYVGRVGASTVRWRFSHALVSEFDDPADLAALKVDGESPTGLPTGGTIGDTHIDCEYGVNTDIGDTWLVDGDINIGGSKVITGGQTGTVKGLITITSSSDSNGTLTAVLNGPVTAGAAGTDSTIEAYDGLDWLPALSVANVQADTPGAGQTTLDLEFLS